MVKYIPSIGELSDVTDVTVKDAAQLSVNFDNSVDVEYGSFSGQVLGHFTLWIDTKILRLNTPQAYQSGPVTLDIKLTGGLSFAPNARSQSKTITTEKTLDALSGEDHPRVRESLEIYIRGGQTGTIQVTASAPTCVSASTKAIRPNMQFMNFEDETWAVLNSKSAFQYPSSYRIPLERYQEVYGDKIGALKYAASGSAWGGNCGGMTWTVGLLATLGLELPSGYSDVVNHQADGMSWGAPYWKTGSGLTRMVEQYQIFQSVLMSESSLFTELRSKIGQQYYRYDASGNCVHVKGGSYIQSICDAIEEAVAPLVVIVDWADNSHAAVIYSNELTDEGGGWYSVPIYDPNHPYKDPNYYSVKPSEAGGPQKLWLNPGKNLFRAYMGYNQEAEEQVRGSLEGQDVAITHGQKTPDLLIMAETLGLSQTRIDPERWFQLYQKQTDTLVYNAGTSLTLADADNPGTILAVIQDGAVTYLHENSGIFDVPNTPDGGVLYLPTGSVYQISKASGRYALEQDGHIMVVDAAAHGLTFDPDTNRAELTTQASGQATLILSNLSGPDNVQAVQLSGTAQTGKTISCTLDSEGLFTVGGGGALSSPAGLCFGRYLHRDP